MFVRMPHWPLKQNLNKRLIRRQLRPAMVLEGGPWTVAGNIIVLDHSYSISPDEMQGLFSPIWIRLPKLQRMYWDPSNIAQMVATVGEPLWMDEHTNK